MSGIVKAEFCAMNPIGLSAAVKCELSQSAPPATASVKPLPAQIGPSLKPYGKLELPISDTDGSVRRRRAVESVESVNLSASHGWRPRGPFVESTRGSTGRIVHCL